MNLFDRLQRYLMMETGGNGIVTIGMSGGVVMCSCVYPVNGETGEVEGAVGYGIGDTVEEAVLGLVNAAGY